MIRVLIAEDEPPTLRRIKRMIEQTDPDFEVVATAGDGETALELLSKNPCDVVFADIRMPVMDGLQLMDVIHASMPGCMVVVVSGYQDFTYVSHALRANATDYLLKPLSQETLAELLSRLKDAYSRREHERLQRRLSTSINRSALDSTAEYPLSDRSADDLLVCLFCAGTVPFFDDAEMYPAASAWDSVSPERMLAETLPGYQGFSWSFMGNTPAERILILEAPGPAHAALSQAILSSLQAQTDIPLSCACIIEGVALNSVGSAIRLLRRQLVKSIRIGKSTFLAISSNTPLDIAGFPHSGEYTEALVNLLRSGSDAASGLSYQSLLARIEAEEWPQRQIHRLFMDALTHLEAYEAFREKTGPMREMVTEALGAALSMDDLLEWLNNLGAVTKDSPAGNTAQASIAGKVERYLRAHYPDHINNQTLSATFGYVPSYISLLFRKTYGISPGEYLTEIRMEEAKKLLESNSDILIQEVAESVGFKSQHHFSRTFKKKVGIWPSKYQP